MLGDPDTRKFGPVWLDVGHNLKTSGDSVTVGHVGQAVINAVGEGVQVSHHPLAIGHWPLAIGHWPLAQLTCR